MDARTAGTDEGFLKEQTGGNYDAHERARPDAFDHPYTGKDYGRERAEDEYFGPKEGRGDEKQDTKATHKATEVTAMGIERLGEAWNNALRGDPEHFFFSLGQLGGY